MSLASERSSPENCEQTKNSIQSTADKNLDVTNQNADADIPKVTPKKVGRSRKTPAKETPTSNGGVLTPKDEGVDTVQQENEKPKRKYVRKHLVQEVEPAAEPPPEEPELEEETQPGGRRRRSAAKL